MKKIFKAIVKDMFLSQAEKVSKMVNPIPKHNSLEDLEVPAFLRV